MISVSLMLFDLDGTLIDSRADLARSINLMLTDLGRPPLAEATVGGFVGDGVRVLVYRSLTATDLHHQPPDDELHTKGIALMHEHYAGEMLKSTEIYPGVRETLDYFKSKRKAVVTSKEVRFTKIILEHFGIADRFDAIVGGDTTPARKPDPRPVIEAVRLLTGPIVSRQLDQPPLIEALGFIKDLAAEAVMVGDSENDINAGRGAGTRTCAVTFGFRTAEQLRLSEPDVIIDRFEQLTENYC
ncbi:MAG: HAD family hydrolase [Acidobacteriota bacterium]